jgi:phage terminase large subunit GpA-like protein
MTLQSVIADPAFLANAVYSARMVAAAVLDPPPPLDLNAWADGHVILGNESPYPGRYDSRRFPFFRKILEVLGPEDAARVIAVKASAQVGKTFIASIFVAASLDLDPGQVLYVHPTEGNAIRYARTKWRPLIRETPRLGEIFDVRQSKEGSNSTLFQQRRDGRGSILLSGANSAASLSMITVKRQVQDDLSKWEPNAAGDPESQADSRSKAFSDAKILKLGTPLLAGSCRITRVFEAGSQHHYHVPCPHCGHSQPLEPENFIATIDPDQPELAHFTCSACEEPIREHHRREIVERGEWVAHNPGAFDLSFYVWAAVAPLESWERIARGYLASQGDPASEQTWWNDTAGRAYELPGEAPPWEDLKRRADLSGRRPGQIPYGALIATLALDVQDDYVDGVVTGFGANLTRWVVARVRVEGFIAQPETRAELNRLVEFEWPTASGTRRKVDLTGIDANAWTDEVFDWAKGYPKSRVIMVRGAREDTAPTLAPVRRERKADGTLTKYQGRFFNIGVSSIKGALYKFLRIDLPGQRGYVDFPEGLDNDFYEQLTAEKRTPIIDRSGFTVHRWIKPRGLRNEQLDTAVYSQALATKLGWRILTAEQWDRLAADREVEGVNSKEHAKNEFWNKEHTNIPAAAVMDATVVRAAPPVPPQPRRRPAVIRSRFLTRRF